MSDSWGRSETARNQPPEPPKRFARWAAKLLRGLVVALYRTVKLIAKGLWRLVRGRRKPDSGRPERDG